MGVEGLVLSIQEAEADVDVRGKRLRAQVADLHVVGASAPSRVSVNVMVNARGAGPTEINVIGCSVDEALGRVERFLDDLLMTDERQVRIIHGHGTGQLRRSIGEFLARHPLVATHQPASHEHGGSGVTVAELKD
jgi:DNA mismatch repair protein MutS2